MRTSKAHNEQEPCSKAEEKGLDGRACHSEPAAHPLGHRPAHGQAPVRLSPLPLQVVGRDSGSGKTPPKCLPQSDESVAETPRKEEKLPLYLKNWLESFLINSKPEEP